MKAKKQPRIAVLTLNPGIDRTMYFDGALVPGEVNRAKSTRTDQGCKGANAAIVLARLGADVTYFTFTGGPFGALYEHFLEKEGIPTVGIPTACGVRLNVKLCDGTGLFTECNQGGGPVSEGECGQMLTALAGASFDCLYMAGSLPAGIGTDFYAECTELAHKKGAYVVADCAGEVLLSTLAAAPDLVKPNRSEFLSLIPQGKSVEEKLAYFKKQYPKTALLLSLGADGAIYTKGQSSYRAAALQVDVRGTVAAGDTFLSVFTLALLSRGDVRGALAEATAAAGAKVQLAGTALPTAEQMRARVGEINVTEY